ncbi:MAG: hypothetical protein HY553_16750 [Elusimicrobia bacterium]|nr:hypothetical protein [Elusimicrobiota bacterium]
MIALGWALALAGWNPAVPAHDGAIGVAGLASAAEPRSAAMPAVLTPLGVAQAAPAAAPASVRHHVQLAGNGQERLEAAIAQTAARFGGRVVPSAAGRPAGPKYLEIVFPPSSLRAQRMVLAQAVKDLGASGAGVISGDREELLPTIEERRAQVAAEAEALKAERAALGESLGKAPLTAKLVDERLAAITLFDPEREPRVAILVVRLAAEVSPATDDVIVTPGVKEKP